MKYKKYTNSSFNQCDIYNILMTYLMIFCNTITLHKVRHVCLYTLNVRYCKGQESIIFKKKNMNLYLDIGLIIMQQFLGGNTLKRLEKKISSFMLRTSKEKESLSLFSNAMQLKCCCNINFVYVYVSILYIKQFS